MDFADLIRKRRMTRSFRSDLVSASVLERVLDRGRRVPSAGNSQGYDFVVLEGQQTALYWDVTLPYKRRAAFRWQGLLLAPVLVTIWADPQAYLRRYSRPDKTETGLGKSLDAWSTPYWLVDGAFAAMALQFAAIDEGLGVLFFGMFEHGEAVAKALGVPSDRLPVGTIALGWPDLETEEIGRSATQERRSLNGSIDSVVHRGGW
ncbi:MAG: nitroreductase family protein [Actinomycetota bacterium]|nr:nitroreductase family protein [Actinomycetota bacterium]